MNRAEPWVRGRMPVSAVIGRTVLLSRPSIRAPPEMMSPRRIDDSSFLIAEPRLMSLRSSSDRAALIVLAAASMAKELSEEQMLIAVMFGHRGFQPVIDMIIAFAEECAKEPLDFKATEYPHDIKMDIKSRGEAELRSAYGITI